MPVNNVNRIFLGNEEVVKAYLGSEQIYPNVPFHAQFDLSQGTSSTTLSLPIPSNSNLRINWGDGTETIGEFSHTYDTIGEYDVKIYGQIRGFRYNNTNQPQKLIRIINWGQFIITTDAVFYGCSNLIIEDLETKVNVETNSMYRIFRNCSSLTTIPLLDTSHVDSMQSMFQDCSSLTIIPLLDTSNVTNMSYMFQNCLQLTIIPDLVTSKVATMLSMFAGCSALTSILSLDTSNVNNMYAMFHSCSSLTTIPYLNTSKVTNMNYMFQNCAVLEVDLSGWCVPLITSLPPDFVTGAPLMTEEKLPIWGTCP